MLQPSVVIQQKNAIEALHAWTKSIADAVGNHAAMLDAQDVEFGHVKGKLARYEQTVSKGLLGAEEQITAAFLKMDGCVAELRSEAATTSSVLRAQATTTSADLATRVAQLEQGMATLQASIPPGLQQGGQQGGGTAGARDNTAIYAVVTELGQELHQEL